MPEPVDIAKALDQVTFLEGRTPDADTDGTFATLAEYRDGGIYAGGFSGTSAWERHPADEIVQILKGATTLILAMPAGIETHALTAGGLIVVPAGVWHRFEAPEGVTVMTVTPGEEDHWEGPGDPF